MSYHAFFTFSTGLAKPIRVPKGTTERCVAHVAKVEQTLGFEVIDNPPRWKLTTPKDGVSDEVLCETARHHNAWIRHLYKDIEKWSKTILRGPDSERMTPKDAAQFWRGLQDIQVPPERWTADYYRNRMEHIYEVLRGNASEGVTFNAKKALTPKQAAAVILLFSEYLDKNDLRLDVPNGHDQLKSSDDGGYSWCDKCGPIDEYDIGDRVAHCRRKECPIREEYGHEYEDR